MTAQETAYPIDIVGTGIFPEHFRHDICDMAMRADVIAGGKRQLETLRDACGDPVSAEELAIFSPLNEFIFAVRSRQKEGKRILVLADGDPLFFGIATRLVAELGPENVRVHPNVTTLQTAAASLARSWHDVIPVSLHGRNDFAPLFSALVRSRQVAVFTDAVNTPARLASLLLERGADNHAMHVFERLGAPEQHIEKLTLEDATQGEHHPLNFILLERVREPELSLHLGLSEDDLEHEASLITKTPVRAAGLSALAITPGSTVWDIGAGSGAVSLEVSFLANQGQVIALERNEARFEMIRRNIRRTGAWNVQPLQCTAPDFPEDLPAPDRIFIGGGLSGNNDVLPAACKRLQPGGRIVAHMILLDSLQQAMEYFKTAGWEYDVLQMQCNTLVPLAGDNRFKPMNPVFILSARKPDHS